MFPKGHTYGCQKSGLAYFWYKPEKIVARRQVVFGIVEFLFGGDLIRYDLGNLQVADKDDSSAYN